ncbi:MAG: AAA family ATPase [Prevotella sp.]|nr:AAA family ATPase [Prevotella sp.]MDD5895534.1 AAA family ATPase [Prevotellaceae bacterium]
MRKSEVIGQEEAWARLTQMAREDRLPHAMMLCGPQGAGKMALAMAFANYLLCRNHTPDDEACEACPQCKMLARWEHPDLHFTFPTIKLPSMGSDHKPVSDDFARQWHEMVKESPYFSMDQWMNAIGAENQQAIITAGESDDLVRKLSLKSSQGGCKVSIIWLPERMNIECANKLLKLIEEPPQGTVFIMVSEEPDKLLETIRSRTQRIDIKRISTESISRQLKERYGLGDELANRMARLANGSWLKAVRELEKDSENTEFLADYQQLMRLAYMRNIHDLKPWSERIAGYGREKQKRFMDYFIRLTRENFMYNFANPDLNYMSEEEEAFANKFARFINEANIIPISEMADKVQRDIKQNANAKIVFFDLALQMIMLLLKK